MPRGIYIKTQEHKDKIRNTLILKGIKPINCKKESHFKGLKRTFKNPIQRGKNISLGLSGRKLSLETRKIMSFNRKGEKHWHWKEDRTQLIKSEKKHLDGHYREWMLGVKRRDNFKCKIKNRDCNGPLESHHILDWKEYLELRYVINNGITLCHAHHPRGRENEAKLSPFFQKLVAEM